MIKPNIHLLLLLLQQLPNLLEAFVVSAVSNNNRRRSNDATFTWISPLALAAQPRRTLKKIRSRQNKSNKNFNNNTKKNNENSYVNNRASDDIIDDEEFWNISESRPMVASTSVLAGEDYWMDDKDLQKSLEREQKFANRKSMEGEITQEKLKQEIAAPYKQNWIGFISVGIIVLVVIGSQFPEVLQIPLIPNVPATI